MYCIILVLVNRASNSNSVEFVLVKYYTRRIQSKQIEQKSIEFNRTIGVRLGDPIEQNRASIYFDVSSNFEPIEQIELISRYDIIFFGLYLLTPETK